MHKTAKKTTTAEEDRLSDLRFRAARVSTGLAAPHGNLLLE